jgi:hypothetical protein
MGWRNPLHVVARRSAQNGEVVVATQPVSASLRLWSAPVGAGAARPVAELALKPGERHRLLAVRAGAEDERGTSAAAYVLWYRIELRDGTAGWAHAAVASDFETGGNGAPASVRFNLLPAP